MKTILTISIAFVWLFSGCAGDKTDKPQPEQTHQLKPAGVHMYPALQAYIETVHSNFETIDSSRKAQLEKIAVYVSEKKDSGHVANLTFICTHNSRRSHMGQIWAQTAARYFGFNHVETFSGGTEATAFNPRAVAAVERAGFKVENPGGENPRYQVRFNDDSEPMICFSKVFGDAYNPQSEFAAVMTCTDADEACPFVPGAEFRVSIPYEDPKVADGTDEETNRYDERCRQIATEMFYLMSKVNS